MNTGTDTLGLRGDGVVNSSFHPHRLSIRPMFCSSYPRFAFWGVNDGEKRFFTLTTSTCIDAHFIPANQYHLLFVLFLHPFFPNVVCLMKLEHAIACGQPSEPCSRRMRILEGNSTRNKAGKPSDCMGCSWECNPNMHATLFSRDQQGLFLDTV